MDAFELEKLRDSLARFNNLERLRETYKRGLSEVWNLNTPSFWDRKLKEDGGLLIKSPIYLDKIKIVTQFLKAKKGKLLDVGVGHGHVEKRLLFSKLNIFGVDISDVYIKKIRRTIKGEFKVGDVLNLPFSDSRFDYLLALDILEHIPPSQTFRAWDEISRVLKLRGRIIVTVPLNEGLEEMVRKGENPNAHVRVYTPSLLGAEMKLSGFDVEKKYYLYAFEKYYFLKSLVVKLIPFQLRQPNLLIVIGRKQ